MGNQKQVRITCGIVLLRRKIVESSFDLAGSKTDRRGCKGKGSRKSRQVGRKITLYLTSNCKLSEHNTAVKLNIYCTEIETKMEVATPHSTPFGQQILNNPEHNRRLTWAPRRPRSKSMFVRSSPKLNMNPRRLCFSEAFEDDGPFGVLATPIEHPVEEMAAMDLNESEESSKFSTPQPNRMRAYTEMTPTEEEQRMKNLHKTWPCQPNENIGVTKGNHRVTRASRRIRLDSIVEQRLKRMSKNVREKFDQKNREHYEI